MSAVLEPLAINLTHITGGRECFYFIVLDEGHEVRELCLGEKCLDLQILFLGISSDDFIHAASSVELVDDEITYDLVVLGDNAHTLALVEAGGEIVYAESVDEGSDDADHDHPERVDGECAAAYADSRHGYGRSYVKMEILVHYLAQDIKPSGGRVDVEQDGL